MEPMVLELLLRSSVPESPINQIITVLPLSAADSRLNKTLLLRTLQDHLTKASITETALEALELAEKIDRNDAVPVSDAMRTAYCAVAVECTVKYLAAFPDDSAEMYFAAVERIWRCRVAELERSGSELFTGEVDRWRDDVEAAVSDPRVSKRLASLNSRGDAFDKVRVYLEEAWGALGPSIPDSKFSENKMKGSESFGAVPLPAVLDKGFTEGVCGVDSGAEPAKEHGDDDGACSMAGAILNGGIHDMEQLDEKGDGFVGGNQESSKEEKVSPLRRQKGKNLQLQRQQPQPALRRCRGRIKISDAEELEPEESCSKYDDPMASSEVKKARESLKSSCMELRAMVKDPLPDALLTSEAARTKLASKDANSEPPTENQNEHVDVPNPNMYRSIVLYQPKDANTGKKPSVHSSNVQSPKSMEPKRTAPKFMEQKNTAKRYEWDDDSMDNKPPQGIPQRRKKRKWSSLEEETLTAGVEKFGEGNWTAILTFYSDIFDNRNGVDLKDKWRNMLRYGHR